MAYQYKSDTFTKIDAEKGHKHSPANVDRNFGLPTGLYAATVGAYLTYLAIMAAGFQGDRMGIVITICMGLVVAAFGVPALWSRMGPDHDSKPLQWAEFTDRGIETITGNMKAKDASAQVLILPLLVLAWGIAIVMIAGIVR